MKTIFDPVSRWLGSSPLVLSETNKRPVTLDDTLAVGMSSGPVTVDVLANDFDPEGAPLTLISASAALGTAVVEADDTVTYTPPVGITGSDTIIYEIADDLDQRQTGQVNVTITAPALTIATQPDNTLVVNAATGMIDITVTTPAAFAGSYQIDTADLAGGPVALVPPAITGSVAEGQVLSAADGLWIHDTGAGEPVQSWQWRRDGVDISGAISADYTVTAGDLASALSVVEIQSDGFGTRLSESAAPFAPGDDAQLLGWWDAADAATITESAGAVSAWADKAPGGGAALVQTAGAAQPVTGLRSLNGLNVLDFDGARFLEAGRGLPGSGDVAIHMAVIVDGADNVFDSLVSVDAANDFQLDANNGAQFDGRLNTAGIGGSLALTGGPFSGAVILSLVFDRTGTGLAEVFIANVSRGVMAYTAALDASVVLRLMANRAGNTLADGAVAEVIVTGDVANRADHHGYLAIKWGLV